MNYRDYKQFAKGNYYHVYNRGNNKQDIFKDNADYGLFLSRLKENLFPRMPSVGVSKRIYERKCLPEGAFSLICYCLMPNHFHMLIRQNTELPLSKLLSKVCTSYSMCFNLKYEQTGQVFQDQFKAISVDNNEYLIWLSAYIHSNPAVAGLVKNLKDWPWSSYGEYLEEEGLRICEKDIVSEQFKSAKGYEQFVVEASDLIYERKNMKYLLFD